MAGKSNRKKPLPP